MMSAGTPIDRSALDRQMVTEADAFTQLRFLRRLEATPTLQELQATGESQFPGVAGALSDLYEVLWNPEPTLRAEVPADRQYWRSLLEGALGSTAYAETHAQTQLSELKSILGTCAMAETVLKLVPKEDQEQLQQLAEAQAEAEQKQQEADKAQSAADEANADAAKDQGDQADGLGGEGDGQSGNRADGQGQGEIASPGQTGVGSPSSGAHSSSGGLTPEAAQVLAEAAAQKQQEATTAQQQVDQLAEQLMGQAGSREAAEKLQELSRMGLAAAQVARDQVSEVSETLDAWGLEEGELFREGMPEAMALLERIKNNPAFKDFAKLLGRIKRIAKNKARSKEKAEGVRVTRQETGRDIKRAVRSERVALAHPALRHKALTRWSRGELRLSGEEVKQKLGEGPVIVCEDSSGSMSGRKQQWAKAVVLALAHYAKLRGRSFVWIMFDARVQRHRMFKRGRLTARDLLEIAEAQSGGGTQFQPPLDEAIRYIREAGLKKADIVFATDGDSALAQAFLDEFNAIKKALEVTVAGVLAEGGHVTDATLRRFCDSIIRASSFSDDEAAQVFSGLG